MGRVIDTLLRETARAGLRRGLSGEHWTWFMLAGAAYGFRRVRKTAASAVAVRLAVGDHYEIRALPPQDASPRRRD